MAAWVMLTWPLINLFVNLEKHSKGRKYEPRRTHIASAPNQPPASDTGFLVSQITMDVDVKANGTVVGQIISAAPYSKHLEFGTVHMTERPFMQPALMNNKRKIQAMFKKGILK